MQWVRTVSPSLILLLPIWPIFSTAFWEFSMKRSALAAMAWRAPSMSSALYFITILMALERETAVGLVLRSRSAATAVFWLKSSKLSAWTARAYSFREAAAAVAILPAPLISMLLIFPAVSVTRSIGFIRVLFSLAEVKFISYCKAIGSLTAANIP